MDLLPVDIFAVETVARARIGGELRPQVIDVSAFADALPKVANAAEARGRGRAAGWRGGTHSSQYKTSARCEGGTIGGLLIATERAAELHGAETELVAKLIGGFREAIELFAPAGFEEIELRCAVA